jgi:hypothetical protein
MAYIYQVSFDVPRERSDLLGRGTSELDRTVAYLNSLLPDFPGFLTSWGMYSLHLPHAVRVVYHSMWARWGDLEAHRRSAMEESKVFSEWTRIDPESITIGIFREVGER